VVKSTYGLVPTTIVLEKEAVMPGFRAKAIVAKRTDLTKAAEKINAKLQRKIDNYRPKFISWFQLIEELVNSAPEIRQIQIVYDQEYLTKVRELVPEIKHPAKHLSQLLSIRHQIQDSEINAARYELNDAVHDLRAALVDWPYKSILSAFELYAESSPSYLRMGKLEKYFDLLIVFLEKRIGEK
jgi:hypothetical protein